MASYKLGVVGLGHWFEMIHRAISKSDKVELLKAAGTRKFSEKSEELGRLGVPEKNYFTVASNKVDIPKEFFQGLDVVQISNPNKYHLAQTTQALNAGKYVITEKSLATNKADLESMIKFINSHGYQSKTYLHLHYMHKLLTINLPDMLTKIIPGHGRIKDFSATFFEEANETDRKRSAWLLSIENGGIFMDWIHPYEILFFGAGADKIKVQKANNFIVNKDYDKQNPTGVETFVKVSGKNFGPNSHGIIRISKGLPHETGLKRFVFNFESGTRLYLNFVGSQIEFNSNLRGNWQLVKETSSSCQVLDSGLPHGPSTSELLLADIIKLCEGRGPYLKMDDIRKVFDPQWQYQKLLEGSGNIDSQEEVNRFIHDGISGTIDK